MTLSIRDNGAWKTATPQVRDNGTWKPAAVYVRDNGTWKLVHSPVTLSISPTSRTDTGTLSLHTFASFTVSVSGGTPTSYTWGFLNDLNGSWTVQSGQGTATAAPKVAEAIDASPYTADFYCDVVVDGTTYRATAPCSYTNTRGL